MQRTALKYKQKTWVQTLASLVCILLLTLPAGMSAAPPHPPAKVSAEQLLHMKERLESAADRVVRGHLLSQGITAPASVNVDFDFDKEKLRKDSLEYYQNWYQSIVVQAATDRKTAFELQKAEIKELAALLGYDEKGISKKNGQENDEDDSDKDDDSGSKSAADKKEISNTKPGARIGSFNLDLLGVGFPDPVSASSAAEQDKQNLKAQKTPKPEPVQREPARMPLTLGLQSFQQSAFTSPPAFTFDLNEYITDLNVRIILPHDAQDSKQDELKKAIADGLGLGAKLGDTLLKKINITKSPAPKVEPKKPEPEQNQDSEEDDENEEADDTTANKDDAVNKPQPTYMQQLFKPDSFLIPAVAASVIIGVILLAAAFLVSSGFTRLAGGLRELKPKEEPAASTAPKEPEPEQKEAVIQTKQESSESDNSSGSSDEALSRILAVDINLIRKQVADANTEDPELMAEVIFETMQDEDGLARLRDFITFAGYLSLKDSLSNLPRNLMNEYSGFVEDNSSEKSNPLTGIEVAQKVYRDFISKRDKYAENKDPNAKKLRKALMDADEAILEKIFSGVTAHEFVILFKTLSMNRVQKYLKTVPKDVLKEAFSSIDAEIPAIQQKTEAIAKKIEDAKGESRSKTSPVQKRLMLRILQNTSPDEEEFIQSLISSDDWDMKSLVMKTRFLFRDIPYVQPAILKKAFESFPSSFRAELFFVSPENIRNSLLSVYAEGARARDLLTSALSDIEKSEKKREQVTRNKNKNIQEFLERLHELLSQDPSTFDDIILKQMQNNSIQSGANASTKKAS
jgi:hypothetical protein